MNSVEISRAVNGYIVKNDGGFDYDTNVYLTFEEAVAKAKEVLDPPIGD